MKARDFLSQAYRIDQRINSKLEQVDSLNLLATKATSTLTGMPKNPNHATSTMADAVCEIIDIKNNLNDDLAKLLKCKISIIQIIQGVNNTEYRLILEKRYLSYQPWEDIAYDLNYSVSWVLKLHRKALRAVDAVIARKENENGLT